MITRTMFFSLHTFECVKKLPRYDSELYGRLDQARVVSDHLVDSPSLVVNREVLAHLLDVDGSDITCCPLEGMDLRLKPIVVPAIH